MTQFYVFLIIANMYNANDKPEIGGLFVLLSLLSFAYELHKDK